MTDPDDLAEEWSACESALAGGRDAAPELGGKLALLKKLHRLCGASSKVAPEDSQQFGRFAVRREIGRGTFGVVYLAFDPELGREVALKVPHAEVLMTPELRQRFRQEAQAAAALDHSNVVTVHEVGEVGAFCYLVSAYCPGGNLAEWLRIQNEPVPMQLGAELVRALAMAVQHAHERGIVHRDLKPANVLLQKASTNSVDELLPRITDFGLAKFIDSDSGGTRTGAIIGTPLYMAPEQATPGRTPVGPGADLYALGAMLYELLCGRPPFTGENSLDVLYQVRHQEPIAPRRLRPRVPRDLETVCLKCLEKASVDRYVSAAELADDLGRYLDGYPVHARPVGPLGKTWRWAQRRPAIVVLLIGLFLSLLGGSIGVLTQWQRAQRNSDATQIEQHRADVNYRYARELTNRLTKLADELTDQPGLDKTRQNLLDEALTQSELFLQERGADLRLRLEVAQTALRAATLRRMRGQRDAALAAFERAVNLFDQLSTEEPDDVELHAQAAQCWLGRGRVHEDAINPPAAIQEYDKAIAILEPLVRQHAKRNVDRYALVNALARKAYMQRMKKPFTGSLTLDAAAETLTSADTVLGPAPAPPTPVWRAHRAQVDEIWVELLSHGQKDFTEHMHRCLEQRRALVREEPAVVVHLYQLAQTLYRLVEPCKKRNNLADARLYAAESATLLEKLIRDFPAVLVYRREGSLAYGLLAVLEANAQHYEAVIAPRQRALELTQSLFDDAPDDVMYRSLIVNRRMNLGAALTQTGRHAEAIANYRQLIVIKKTADALNEIAWLLATAPDAQLRDPAEALRLAQGLVEDGPNSGKFRTTLGAALLATGNARAAIEELTLAAKQTYSPPTNGYLQAIARVRLGEPKEARMALDQSNANHAELLNENPDWKRIAAEATAAVNAK